MEQINLKQYYNQKQSIVAIVGKSIVFATMQFAILSVEVSSKFSIKNFTKDQHTLQHAADALSEYIFMGLVWTLGTSLIFFANYGMKGILINLITNFLIILWIMSGYKRAFNYACDQSQLEFPVLFRNFINKKNK
jgi:hypothetical protein